MQALKLPRQLEADPRREALEKLLAQDQRPLWERGRITVAHVAFSETLEKALKKALHDHQIERGLENIEKILNAQKKGLEALRERDGAAPANRISRLLVIPDDCPERFYRNCEAVLFNHGDRVLGLRVDVPFETLADKLFGTDALVKVLMVSERDSVVNVLASLVAGAV